MEKKILIVACVLMGSGLLISAFAGSLTMISVLSCALALVGYAALRDRR